MALDLNGYHLTFNDDFNSFSSTPQGSGGWQSTIYGARTLSSNGEQQYYSDSTVGVDPFSVANGELTITASPGSNPDGLWYNSGVISTLGDFSQQYGYFEMRAKMPEGSGMWPGFWLLQSDHSWPPEVDVLEAFGATNSRGEGGADQAHINAISTVPGESQGNWVNVPGNIYNEFHDYGVDWQPDYLTYYIDGQEVGKVKTPADMHEPMYMIANLAVGGGWAEGATGETSHMTIDHIRAYSKDPSYAAAVQPDPASAASDPAGHDTTAPDSSLAPPTGSATADSTATGAADGTALAATPTDSAQTQASDGTGSSGVVDGGAGSSTVTDQAAGSPSVTAAADTTGGTSVSPIDATSTNASQPGAAAGTSGSPADHAMGSPDVTTTGTTSGQTSGDASTAATANDAGASASDTIGTVAATGAASAAPSGATSGSSASDVSSGDASSTGAPGHDVTAISSSSTTTASSADASAADPSASGTASADNGVTIHVSADSWSGNPQFLVFVDGKQVGGVQTTAADHSRGQWQDITLDGTFGDGPHVVDVTFVNDTWNGTADTDRNLYVQSVAMNGITMAGNEAANNAHHGAWVTDPDAAVMQINGTVEFQVPESTASNDLWSV